MSHQHLFEPVIGVPPPSTLDVDEFIGRQRRAQRRRRIGAIGTGAAAAFAVTVTVLAAVSAVRGGPAPDDGGASSHETPPPTVGAYVRPTDPAAFHAEFAARMNPAVRAAVLAVRPDVTLEDNDVVPDTEGLEFGHNRPDQAPPTVPETYYASADVRDAEGRGMLEIAVGFTVAEADQVYANGWPSWPEMGLDTVCPTDGTETLSACDASTGPDGSRIVAKTRYFVNGVPVDEYTQGASVEYEVHVTKPDGTQLQLWSTNFDRYAPGPANLDDDRVRPPFSAAELTEIAVQPALTFYP
jgi:hypothetical protein